MNYYPSRPVPLRMLPGQPAEMYGSGYGRYAGGGRGGGAARPRMMQRGMSRGMRAPLSMGQMGRTPGMINGGISKAIRKNRHVFNPYEFVAMPETVEHKSISVSPTSLSCFHGANSPFTLQHKANFTIDGTEYKSVDQYYQMSKISDLLGVKSGKFTDGSIYNYSGLARDLLRDHGIATKTVDKWRVTRGVGIIQKALLQKTIQCQAFRQELVKTGERLIVQSYAGDDFFGAGVPVNYVKTWASGMEQKKVLLKLPMTFPLTPETMKHIPSVGKGKNLLGAILMILREKLNNGQLDGLEVDLELFGEAKEADGASRSSSNMDLNQQGAPLTKQLSGMDFASSKNSSHEPDQAMDIDFTADYDLPGPTPFIAPTPAVAKPVMLVSQKPANGVAEGQKPTAGKVIKVTRTTLPKANSITPLPRAGTVTKLPTAKKLPANP